MSKLSQTKVPMREQDPKSRIKNFNEVSLGYTDEEARQEAKRCLNCKNKPCVSMCPISVPIPDFIKKVSEGDMKSAYDIIFNVNSLPAICGRVCPQEKQCESACVRGVKGDAVSIGRLERYVADWVMARSLASVDKSNKKNGHKVCVVGSGPAGLACAGKLARLGYSVTVYEALHEIGGVLVYGIPEFRLPKSIVLQEISNLTKCGVEFHTDVVVGKTLSVDDILNEGFESIFIASGAGLPRFMGIEGESLKGVYSANEFLTRINLMKAYDENYDTPILKSNKTIVIGGGNVAMDAARCAKRVGSDYVCVVYRRSEKEMPAREEEFEHAKREGIDFKFLCNPVRVVGDENGNVVAVECVKMKLTNADDSGRCRPVVIEGSNFMMDAKSVIMAIGNSPNPLISSETKELKTDKKGCFVVDMDSLMTTKQKVFAGGDAVTGAATVILAMEAGKKAAYSIDKFITENKS